MAVFRRGSVWWYAFQVQGRRIRESSEARTRADARRAEAIRKAEVLKGAGSTPSASFTDFAYGQFASWCESEHQATPSTYARYMRCVKALCDFFGNRPLSAIDAGLVERYKQYRSTSPRKNARDGRLVSAAAVNRELALLRILFKFAIRLGLATSNPVSEVRFLKEPLKHMRVVSAAEEQVYLGSCGALLHDVAIVMLETGMRPSEVCRLDRDAVDLKRKVLLVRHGKTLFARRHIPLTDRALAALENRLRENGSQWLFPCPVNPALPVQEVRKSHDAALRRCGIVPKFRLYDLRHTALSRMAMSGMDLATLKEIAGHSQIQMTLRYVHPTPEHKLVAIQNFQKFNNSHSAESTDYRQPVRSGSTH